VTGNRLNGFWWQCAESHRAKARCEWEAQVHGRKAGIEAAL